MKSKNCSRVLHEECQSWGGGGGGVEKIEVMKSEVKKSETCPSNW